jgi:hypothetical protein
MTRVRALSGFAVGFPAFNPQTRQEYCHRNQRARPRLSEMSGFLGHRSPMRNESCGFWNKHQAIRASNACQNLAADLFHERT